MAELDMNDAQTLEIYSRVLLFKDDTMRDELAFSRSLSAHQRRVVHLVAQKLGMEHASVGEGTERHAVVYKPGALPENMETKVRCWCALYGMDWGSSHVTQTVRSHRSSNNLRKKSMPNMRSSNETQGVPPMGSLGLGGAGGRMLAGRKSQGDLRPKSSGQAPPPPPPVPSQAALLDPNNSPTGTASSSGSNPASCGPKSGTTRAARSASAAGTKGRAEQSRDWRVPAAAPAPSDFERPSAQTVEALQL